MQQMRAGRPHDNRRDGSAPPGAPYLPDFGRCGSALDRIGIVSGMGIFRQRRGTLMFMSYNLAFFYVETWHLRHFFALISFAVMITAACAAQTSTTDAISARPYENPQYGLSVVIPNGWQAASAETMSRVRPSVSEPSSNLFLAMESDANTLADRTTVVIERERLDDLVGTATDIGRQYVEKVARMANVSVMREPFRILLGGIEFYRIDLRERANGNDRNFAVIAVGRRGSVIAISVQGNSQRAVDDAVGMLVRAVHFMPDWSVPDSELDTSKFRIRVSMGVSEGLLKKKVEPIYPQDAKRAKVQGYVMLGALISRMGEVQRLWVAEGDPLLAPAAIDAVRQWKYRPYLLNGEPVIVETKVAIKFDLHR